MIPVFFSSKMVAVNDSPSPSAGKPSLVVESWKKLGVPLQFHEPAPVSIEDFALVHDREFVKNILSCRQDNGFENKSAEVAAALPYTSGAMLSAAKHVLRTGAKVAAAPCSGFHHAGYKTAEGYCTFNGLMVTAAVLKRDGLANKIGILDFDMHYGNGTDNIIGTIKAREWVAHYTAGLDFRFPDDAERFFEELPAIMDKMIGCDIVLYQAGADPHIDDPHGGWLTTEQLRLRDSFVFEALNLMGIAVVWNLAGGYQVEKDGSIPKVLEIHDNTMYECARAFCPPVITVTSTNTLHADHRELAAAKAELKETVGKLAMARGAVERYRQDVAANEAAIAACQTIPEGVGCFQMTVDEIQAVMDATAGGPTILTPEEIDEGFRLAKAQ
jgi:acetoin utilization deacetylase AcuC-like enzyme